MPKKVRRSLTSAALVRMLGGEDATKLMRDYHGHRMPSLAAWNRYVI